MFFFSIDNSFFSFTEINFHKILVIVIGVVLNVVFIGQLKRMQLRSEQKLYELNYSLQKDNMTLAEASLKDALTGLRNRFALRQDFVKYVGRYIHVMMLDLDGFKQVNDNFGHDTGDGMLRQVGVVLRETFGVDSCYRYGGDEFLIICTEVSEENFVSRIKEIRRGFANVHVENKPMPVHFSSGYVYGRAELTEDLRLMIRQADSFMYHSKRNGTDICSSDAYDREKAHNLQKRRDEV